MVNNCANPKCNKPLHYLRDGRIFVFEMTGARTGPDGKRLRHLQHYWLCGDCSVSMVVEPEGDAGVAVHSKTALTRPASGTLLAS